MGAVCSSERSSGAPGNNSRNVDTKDIYVVTVPNGARPNQELLINTSQGQMRVRIPPGVRPGQQFRAAIPRRAPVQPAASNNTVMSAIPVDNPFRSQPSVAAFEVRGAGTGVVNGIYEAASVVDGVRSYRKRGTNIMLHRYPSMERRGTSIWWIADWGRNGRPANGDETDFYYASSSSSTPPQVYIVYIVYS